jgi:hypothetical protein
VIAVPRSNEEWQAMTGFLRHYAHVMPTPDTQCIGWISNGINLVMVVGLQGFIGKVAQIHVAYYPGWHFTPRSMLREVFHYAFVTAKLEMLLGVVNSKNTKAMRMDKHLGFRELLRLPKMHDDGGDLVLLAMKKSECRYLVRADDMEPMQLAAAGGA